MKNFSAAPFIENLLKNKLFVAAFSLILMIVAASSILSCEKEIAALEKKWRSFCLLNEVWGYEDNKTITEGQFRDPTRYDIRVSLVRFVLCRSEIRFCDQYSFVLSNDYRPSGVYYKTQQGREEYVSTAKYPRTFIRTVAPQQRSENFRLRFKCDLAEKTVLVYMNGKFMEKIPLGPGPIKDSFGLFLPPGRKEAALNRLEISDPKGGVLFSVNFFPFLFYKLIAQTFLSLGVLIFLVLGCSEKDLFRKALFFVSPLIFLEVFLRTAYPLEPDLDIDRLKPKWQFEISTNFFGAFNDPGELTIRSYRNAPSTYPVANPEHATRILCVGSSPLAYGVPSPDQAFPAILERKVNAWNGKKNIVIPLAVPLTPDLNSPELVIFLKEVLKKMSPDLVLYYGKLVFPEGGYYKERFGKDYAFYRRAKKVMEKNSDWIKNDRLLYAALEFKEPVKEVVYLYDFLCKSYLFMAVENIRKKFLGAQQSGDPGAPVEDPDSFFEEVLTLCKEKGIKAVFIPQLDFLTCSNDKQTEESLASLRREHPEIHYLNLEDIFKKNRNFLFAKGRTHLDEYGHEVIAEEIFRQLIEKGVLNIHG